MGPASSREQIGEQIGDDDGLQIHPKTTIVANNVVSVTRTSLCFVLPYLSLALNRTDANADRTQRVDEGRPAVLNPSTLPFFATAVYLRL